MAFVKRNIRFLKEMKGKPLERHDYVCPKCFEKYSSTENFTYKGHCPKCDTVLRPYFKSMKTFGNISNAKMEQSKDMKADLIHFLQKHPNPSDDMLHKWAEWKGYNVHEVEAIAYELATKHVKKHLEYVEPLPESEADPNELKMGIEVELEHTDDRDKAKVIALQHLAEMPDYYTKLKKMEAGVKKEYGVKGMKKKAKGLGEDVFKLYQLKKLAGEQFDSPETTIKETPIQRKEYGVKGMKKGKRKGPSDLVSEWQPGGGMGGAADFGIEMKQVRNETFLKEAFAICPHCKVDLQQISRDLRCPSCMRKYYIGNDRNLYERDEFGVKNKEFLQELTGDVVKNYNIEEPPPSKARHPDALKEVGRKGLVPKKVKVKRKGKVFQQIRWVKPSKDVKKPKKAKDKGLGEIPLPGGKKTKVYVPSKEEEVEDYKNIISSGVNERNLNDFETAMGLDPKGKDFSKRMEDVKDKIQSLDLDKLEKLAIYMGIEKPEAEVGKWNIVNEYDDRMDAEQGKRDYEEQGVKARVIEKEGGWAVEVKEEPKGFYVETPGGMRFVSEEDEDFQQKRDLYKVKDEDLVTEKKPEDKPLSSPERIKELESEGGDAKQIKAIEEFTKSKVKDVMTGERRGNIYEMEDGSEYNVHDSFEDAERTAVENVKEDLEDDPSMFNQDWLHGHIDEKRLKDELYSDVENMSFDDVKDDPEAYGLTKEDGEEETQAFTDAVEKLTNDKLEDPVQYLKDLGSEDMLKNYIDIDKAAEEAVNIDGVAHFLASYDGEEVELKDGRVAYRTN